MAKKRPSIDPSPSYSYHAAGDDARARMRHQTLLQDYQDLIKEADVTKKRILKAKQKKLKLSAEVKFLRRKLKSFAGSHSLEVPLKLKKESYRVAIPSPEFEQMHNSGLPSVAHLDNRSHEITEAATQGTSALSHLNQVSNRPASPTLKYTQMQMLNLGLPSNDFSVDRNYKVAEAAARGITAGLDLNQASNRPMSLSMSYAYIHNSDLPPKAPPVDRNHKVAKAATLKTTALSDSNQVSYRPVPSSSRYSHMLNSGLPPKAPRNHKVTEAATRADTALFDLNEVSYRAAPPTARYAQMNSSDLPSKDYNEVSYRAAPPTARYAQMNSSGLPSKDYTVAGNYKVAEAATRRTSTLLDLNQDAENFEEQESPRIDNLKRFSVGGSATMNDHKQMLHRVGGNDRNQLPLRV